MRFEQALQAMREGKKVKLKNNKLQYNICDGKIWQNVDDFSGLHILACKGIACSDILSEYWEIVDE